EEIDPKSVYLDLGMNLLLTEKQASQERMVSTIFYETSDGYDYLSERSNDDATLELPANWVAFKQSYFSSILIPENKFPVEGTSLKVRTYKEGNIKGNKYVKDYSAKINLGLNSTADGKVKMSWYFGPNDYKILSSYDKNLEDIINLGWGLFRWVNIYMIQPIYQVLINIGMGAGIAILVLTILIKLILTPVTWKMYVSSAKMRILKPQIEELALKFPKKEDAMKKQMETMALYRESGASPLSGCLPMLIQMPILFAVFRFFPSDFSIRQHGFLWANDLSTYDAIATWQQHIPILSSIYGNHISLFTLLMAATTLVYTHVNSGNMQQPTQQPGMPNMKVIMYLFPVMMIFFFNNYSAGLSYYYFISTLMSILIMYGIKIFFVDEEKLKAKMALRQANMDKKGGGSKKSKFQERLETMQKQQQDRKK
ncbi:MAG: membrane protein insertase YidC, partial [Crocinitomicaceae bacterium]